MNEGVEVFLNIEEEELGGGWDEIEELICRIDGLMLEVGMRYSGYRNLYVPVNSIDRDQAVFASLQALESAQWLKDRLSYTPVLNRTNACALEEIRVDHMSKPSSAKFRYYEEYYQASYKLAHGIVVDEDRRLREGYVSYLLAKKYGVRPDVYEAYAGQPLSKIVNGVHVSPNGGAWRRKGKKRYAWKYPLRKPVVPGDILKVETKEGYAFICVDDVGYVTGEEFCGKYANVVKHTGKRLALGA